MAQFQLGSISTGTLRTEDLLTAFTEALRQHIPGMIVGGEVVPWPNYSIEDQIEQLEDNLNQICPPFVYFGTLPGDGADFGFWPDMDDFNESRRLDGNYQGNPEEVWHVAENVISHVSDHGNVTVMDMERNVLWSVV